ncbi:MAG: GumC family protein, partial [Sphingopyxis sp.]
MSIDAAQPPVPSPAPNAVLVDGQPVVAGGAAQYASLPLVLQYWNIAWRRRYLILAILASALVAGFIATWLATQKVTASARIEIAREQANVTNVQGLNNERAAPDMEFYSTQYSLLGARTLAERVVRQLNLARNDAFFAAHGATPDDATGIGGAVRGGVATAAMEKRRTLAADLLLDNIEISPIRGSALVDVRYTSASPDLAARISNSWIEQFIQQSMDRRFASTAEARRFLETRLEDLRTRLDRSERDLVNYAANRNIVRLGAAESDGQTRVTQTLASADVQALNAELASATAARVAAEGRRNATRSRRVSEGSINSIAINGLRQRRAEVASDLAKMLVQFEPGYEPAVALRRQVESLDAAIAREESRALSVSDADFDAALSRENGLRARVNQLLGALSQEDRNSIQYNILQREADTNRQLYDGLLQRYKEIGVTGVGVNNIAVVDPAILPVKPSSPRLFLNLALALLAGLGIAAVVTIVLENLDEGVRDPSVVNRSLNVPLLGAIPVSEEEDVRALLSDPKSIISEAYMTVRSNLGFSTDHGVPKTLMITSTSEAEGKSTTSIALAAVLGRSGKQVVLIDCDMRKPALNRYLTLQSGQGLSNYLAGEDVADAIVFASPLPNVAILGAGPIPPSASELLSGDRLKTLIEHLRTRFDHVVIDSPPMLGLAEAALISRTVEGVVYVIETNRMPVRGISSALNRLREARAR